MERWRLSWASAASMLAAPKRMMIVGNFLACSRSAWNPETRRLAKMLRYYVDQKFSGYFSGAARNAAPSNAEIP